MKFLLIFLLGAVSVPAMALDLYRPAVGPPHQGDASGERNWEDPPDLNGNIGSSEQILVFGVESEIANDFIADGSVVRVDWWGGYWNGTPIPTNSNLRFYEDAGCVPGAVHSEYLNIEDHETPVGSVYAYFYDVDVPTMGGTLYWFGAQFADHAYPPQCGRLAAMAIQSCESVFKSEFFGYPNWTPAGDVFGQSYEASQSFISGIPPWEPEGACCTPQGECWVTTSAYCESIGGEYQGNNTPCDPNPCESTPTRKTSWGTIKSIYR